MSVRRGWAWGITNHGEWLSIAGSAHARPHLADTPREATPYPANIVNTVAVLALVEEQGGYFRILETTEAAP
ncbi:hypothetical protein [Actinoplanes sp. URMC 104]|uniref:hypothetical protein n=1 Tax=Actinoplanes sp. URMC 104 TaxID=3423409 RepID=UPI003F1BAF09